jgi:peptidoglycan hydrolase-like amidase
MNVTGCYALTVYNGELIAGGEFTYAGGVTCNGIARWNGSQWQPLGTGMNGSLRCRALTVYNGELIAGGWFTTAGGVTCNYIARWNGSQWQPLGTGMA